MTPAGLQGYNVIQDELIWFFFCHNLKLIIQHFDTVFQKFQTKHFLKPEKLFETKRSSNDFII